MPYDNGMDKVEVNIMIVIDTLVEKYAKKTYLYFWLRSFLAYFSTSIWTIDKMKQNVALDI